MRRRLASVSLVAVVLMLLGATGCANTGYTRYQYVGQPYGPQQAYGQRQYVNQSVPRQVNGQPGCYNGVYSCPPPGAVVYQAGYQGPAPQYGPYGYSAAMTARVTPPVYVMPSPPVLQPYYGQQQVAGQHNVVRARPTGR